MTFGEMSFLITPKGVKTLMNGLHKAKLLLNSFFKITWSILSPERTRDMYFGLPYNLSLIHI